MERYFTQTEAVDFISGQAEAALVSIMKNGLIVRDDHENYDAWSQIGLAGSFAHNGYFGLGHDEDWACHGIEHELSAWDETITHGEGLAVLTPAWMKHVWKANPARFERFAVNVMGAKGDTQEERIENGIEALKGFFKAMGAPVTMRELGAENAPFARMAELVTAKTGSVGNFVKLTAADVEAIYLSAK